MHRRDFIAALAACAVSLPLLSGPVQSAEPVKIAVVLKTLSSQYWKGVATGAQEAAKANKVELILLGPPTEDAIEQQINMVQDVIARHPAALVFSPSQPTTAVSIVAKARAAGIPVLLVDTSLPDTFTDYTTFIGTDNVAAGRIGGRALAATLKRGAKVVLIDGAPGNSSTIDRVKGAEEALTAAGLVIAGRQPAYSDREKAYTVMQNILQSTPDVAGVFAATDEMALGARRALKQAGKAVPVIGVDGNSDNIKAIRAGEIYGTVAQANSQMGRLGVEKALDVIAGRSVDKRIDSGARLITRDDIP
ncbi:MULTISPECIES: sugar ABC transporter substrate-binding protein [unclassified Methylobacterium]|uniref:sugar ABC transporter substrate-binding protein n=1 Tax=unclassified Methylobacterium TaxID=2615210 RepID=UPI001354E811|nr:sugar ABC transporter substrate-binding protein [Methylobacterium sp. 2A]MWV23467.1 substrate-binding domain-containing protein [Methylobacterium sp. 2A]